MKPSSDTTFVSRCPACEGSGLLVSPSAVTLERETERILSALPLADIMGRGQWFFSASTVVQVAMYMCLNGDVEGRRIACLGTPTLAVGLELLRLHCGLEETRIAALDIDGDVLQVLSQFLPELDSYQYDIEDVCPRHLSGSYDVFTLDPLYSVDHYALGLSRCVDLVGEGRLDAAGYVVVPPPEIAPVLSETQNGQIPLHLSVARIIGQIGFCVMDMRPRFMEYVTPLAESRILNRRGLRESDVAGWRNSDLLRLASTIETSPLLSGHGQLRKRVNSHRRIGRELSFVPLCELADAESICSLCPRCFSSHIEDQRAWGSEYRWPLSVVQRPIPSWRDVDDQPYEVAPSCKAFIDIRDGCLVVLQGPGSRFVWETLADVEDLLQTDPSSLSRVLDGLNDVWENGEGYVHDKTIQYVQNLVELGLLDLDISIMDRFKKA